MEKWLDPKTITLWIAIIIAVISLLVFSFIKLVYLNMQRIVDTKLEEARVKLEYQKKLIETGILAQEQERTRIAADLHDSLIGKLTALKLKSQVAPDSFDFGHSLDESIAEARRISHDLYPPLLEYRPLGELIEDMLYPWKKEFRINFVNCCSNNDIASHIKVQLTRILQEIITNIYKHSMADTVTVQLRTGQRGINLLITDNGCGFDTSKNTAGLGLRNIELRMLYLRGSYKIKSTKNGTSVLFAINY